MVEVSRRGQSLLGLMEQPHYEVLPLPSATQQIDLIPRGSTITITSSPAKGVDATLLYAADIAERGFRVIPHIAARGVTDEEHLARMLEKLTAAGIKRIFAIGGDNQNAGMFADSLSLIRGIEALGYAQLEIGIAGYPEGHPFISDAELRQALEHKQPYASFMTTQVCFDPKAISRWISDVRAQGIKLPVHLGIPGVMAQKKLLGISAKIGVGSSIRYLARHKGLLRSLMQRTTYYPDDLIRGLTDIIGDPDADIAALHFNTFNQLEPFEMWRRDWLASHA